MIGPSPNPYRFKNKTDKDNTRQMHHNPKRVYINMTPVSAKGWRGTDALNEQKKHPKKR